MPSAAVVSAIAALLVILFRVIWNEHGTLRKYSHIPQVGLHQKTWLGLFKARFRNTTDFKNTTTDSFRTYSRRGNAYALPMLSDDFVVLPPEESDWIINQADDILNARQVQEDIMQLKYTVTNQYIRHNLLHHDVIKRDLTRRMGELTSDIIEELAASIDDEWGNDTENWNEIVVFQSMMKVIARTSNRVFVGLPICRDATLLENGKGFAATISISALLLKRFPSRIRPIIAPLVAYKTRAYARRFIEHLCPIIEARQAKLDSHISSQMDGQNRKQSGGNAQPNDLLQWLITAASKTESYEENKATTIAARILNLNFAAIHTSTFSITNAFFDLAAPPSSESVLSVLRNEVSTVLAENDGVWSKKALAQMHLLDSTLRESSRLGSFLTLGLTRKVVVKNGITSPISKTFLPHGTVVCVPTNRIHHDDGPYPNAETFKPFRFAELRKAYAAAGSQGKTPSDESSSALPAISSSSALAFTTTSPTYHPFGHGRHACPGRFFASHELKLLLAYILLNYDFEMLDERPENAWLGTTVLPPMKQKIRVRRRKVT